MKSRLQHRGRDQRRTILRLGTCLAVVMAGGAAWLACSLGSGVSPDCDPNAAPNSPDACHQVSACDDGQGNPIKSDECCGQVADRAYKICEGTDDVAWSSCPAGSTTDCCGEAQIAFDICMSQQGTGGSGGGGGSGGSSSGTGGATGGAGGSSGGAGGGGGGTAGSGG
ncbi:MAG: hypothetical protein JRI68_07285 [Deltaproteobacteria bacterium]|nr:hypothetical protein [Deltaproteobacteria bacterium]